MIVRVRVVLKRTVVGDSNRRFDNMSERYHQSQLKSCFSVECFRTTLTRTITRQDSSVLNFLKMCYVWELQGVVIFTFLDLGKKIKIKMPSLVALQRSISDQCIDDCIVSK